MDIVRVLRVIEYVGPRNEIEDHLKKCLHGEREIGLRSVARAATIGLTPDIIEIGKIEQMLPPVTQKSSS